MHATQGQGRGPALQSPRVRGRGIESSALISSVLGAVQIVGMGSCSRSAMGSAAPEGLAAPGAEALADDAVALAVRVVVVAAAGVDAELGVDESISGSLERGEVGAGGDDDHVEGSDSWRGDDSDTGQAALLARARAQRSR